METSQIFEQQILSELYRLVLANGNINQRFTNQSLGRFLRQQSVSQRNSGLLSLLVVLSHPLGAYKNQLYLRQNTERLLNPPSETDFNKVYTIASGGRAECCDSAFNFHTLRQWRDDMDLMVSIRDYELLNIPNLADIRVEFHECLPIYMNLYAIKNDQSEELMPNTFFQDNFTLSDKQKLPLSSSVLNVFNWFQSLPHEIRGPAYKSHTFQRTVLASTPKSTLYSETDVVYCIEIPRWVTSDILLKWALRDRTVNWPTQQLITKVKHSPCHFVPVGPKLQQGKEWRLSFSVAETLLLTECGYGKVLVFICGKVLLKRFTCVATYMLKTAFLWMLETVPETMWTLEETIDLATALIRRLLVFYARSSLPHYFLPRHNLLDDISYVLRKIHQTQLVCCLQNLEDGIMKTTLLSQFMSKDLFREIEHLTDQKRHSEALVLCWEAIHKSINTTLQQVLQFFDKVPINTCDTYSHRFWTVPVEILHLNASLIYAALEISCDFELPYFKTYLYVCDRAFHSLLSQHFLMESSNQPKCVFLAAAIYKFLVKVGDFLFRDNIDGGFGRVLNCLQLYNCQLGRIYLHQSFPENGSDRVHQHFITMFSRVPICDMFTVVNTHLRRAMTNPMETLDPLVQFMVSDLRLHVMHFTRGMPLSSGDPLCQNNALKYIYEDMISDNISVGKSGSMFKNRHLTRYALIHSMVFLACFNIREKFTPGETKGLMQSIRAQVSKDEFVVFRRYQKSLFPFSKLIQNIFDWTELHSEFVSINTTYLLDLMFHCLPSVPK